MRLAKIEMNIEIGQGALVEYLYTILKCGKRLGSALSACIVQAEHHISNRIHWSELKVRYQAGTGLDAPRTK